MKMYGSDSKYSTVNLYTIPHFVGNARLQDDYKGEPLVTASSKGEDGGSLEIGTGLDDKVSFTIGHPVQKAFRPDTLAVNNTAYSLQGSLIHVTPFDHPDVRQERTLQILESSAVNAPVLIHSVKRSRKVVKSYRKIGLLGTILANPRLRNKRAKALIKLENEAAKIDFESAQAPFQISELYRLSKIVSSKTETPPGELFARYMRSATERRIRSKPEESRSEESEGILQPLSSKPSTSEDSKQTPIFGEKALRCHVKKPTKNLLKLHNAINSGATIPESQFKSVRNQVKQLSYALQLDQEVELLKFDFLYDRRFR